MSAALVSILGALVGAGIAAAGAWMLVNRDKVQAFWGRYSPSPKMTAKMHDSSLYTTTHYVLMPLAMIATGIIFFGGFVVAGIVALFR